ncbi:hypothetical protein DSCO28_36780 [Desulfosarcina ovata subsp. sediminis]|uniref:Uncharacterized protein n=1 Tax=Desulfosarcina ovata subsp. sediminis TaxID=885957 RepID=A0A5K7ZSD0_9BACT|nr:hypothetical protein DSCO28_36780 [Desulfosarcina ovata subsp. sediminis]
MQFTKSDLFPMSLGRAQPRSLVPRIVQQALKTPRIAWPEIPFDLDPISEYFAKTGA